MSTHVVPLRAVNERLICGGRGILHNPKIYPEPYEFIPERFLQDGKSVPDVLDPNSVIFGFGRR